MNISHDIIQDIIITIVGIIVTWLITRSQKRGETLISMITEIAVLKARVEKNGGLSDKVDNLTIRLDKLVDKLDRYIEVHR